MGRLNLVRWKARGLQGESEKEKAGTKNEQNMPKMQERPETPHQKGTAKMFHEILGFRLEKRLKMPLHA